MPEKSAGTALESAIPSASGSVILKEATSSSNIFLIRNSSSTHLQELALQLIRSTFRKVIRKKLLTSGKQKSISESLR